MSCECELHTPNDSEVSERIDPGDGRAVVRWCLVCFEGMNASWDAYLDYLEGVDKDWRLDRSGEAS